MGWIATWCVLAAASADPVQVVIDAGEAEAVLAILDARHAGRPVSDAQWQELLATEGYRRLQRREAAMGRAFEDEEFREFVLSPELLDRREALRRTLAGWSDVDPSVSASKALRYLPAGASIRATIFPVIKPWTNSFVFELSTDPAIFFYLDPERSAGVFENTMAHELHHVGYAAACADREETGDEAVDAARRWTGAFGEGFAMLAAAGDPAVHPHAESPVEDRVRWDRDVAEFDRDLKRVEEFFLDVLDGTLATDEERLDVARSLYGVQGPWYTVGWKMAVTIEQAFGRERLLTCICDPVRLLMTYNEAAPVGQARWSSSLLARLAER